MKRVCFALFLGVVALGLNARPAQAVPEFKKKFDAKYVEGNSNAGFVTAAGEAKCNVCHYGTTKKNRNDYGTALSKLLKKDNFSSDRVKAEPEKAEKEIYEAFQKVEEMKSTGGKTFGELIKSGQLPGTAPAE